MSADEQLVKAIRAGLAELVGPGEGAGGAGVHEVGDALPRGGFAGSGARFLKRVLA